MNQPQRWHLGRHAILILALDVYLVVLAISIAQAKQRTGGEFIYPLDDTYIHLAMGRNLAENGSWGLRAGDFAAASSSPLWALVLGGTFFAVGTGEMTPLVINALLSMLLLAVVHVIACRERWPGYWELLVLLAMVFGIPLVSLTMTGMEHVLQTVLSIGIVYLAATLVDRPTREFDARATWGLTLLLALATPTRYEGLFLALAVGSLLAWGRQWLSAFMALAAAILPALIYAAISVPNGGLPAPNPVLLKGELSEMPTLRAAYDRLSFRLNTALSESPYIVSLGVAALVLVIIFYKSERVRRCGACVWMFLVTTLLHLMFAKQGSMYRYDAYLVALGIFSIAMTLGSVLPPLQAIRREQPITWRTLVALGMLVWIGMTNYPRGWQSLFDTPVACKNIYDQQWQMAKFISEFFDGETVAINDIGAIAYATNAKIVDLQGLASTDVARARIARKWNPEVLAEVCSQHGVKIAILYDFWFTYGDELPRSWTRVGGWIIPNNVICGDDEVSFYAADPQTAAVLFNRLAEFSHKLPPGVGKYLKVVPLSTVRYSLSPNTPEDAER